MTYKDWLVFVSITLLIALLIVLVFMLAGYKKPDRLTDDSYIFIGRVTGIDTKVDIIGQSIITIRTVLCDEGVWVRGPLDLLTLSWHNIYAWESQDTLKLRDKNGLWYEYATIKGELK